MRREELLAIACALGLSTAGAADASNSEAVRGVVVAKSERPSLSGVISAWVEISIEDKAGASTTKVFIPYMTEKQRLPKVGKSCDFNYHIEDINGAVGRKLTRIPDAKVVERFVCRGTWKGKVE